MLVRKDLKDINGELSKRSYKELMNDFLDDLEKDTKFHIIDRKFGNSYFLFDYEDDSICHFKIKELSKYTFAIWSMDNVNRECWDADYKDADFVMFAQATKFIDKFKPSRSALKVPISRYLHKPNCSEFVLEEWASEAKYLLKFMKHRKYEAFYISFFSDVVFYDLPTKFEAFREYLKTYFYYYKSRIKEILKTKSLSYKIRKYLKKNFRKNKQHYICALYSYRNWSPDLHLLFYVYPGNLDVVCDLQDKYFNDLSLLKECKSSKDFTKKHNKLKRDKEIKLLWLISD